MDRLITVNKWNKGQFEGLGDSDKEKEPKSSEAVVVGNTNDKLQTVNKYNAKKFNKAAFMPDEKPKKENLFVGGGDFGTGTTQYGSSFFGDGYIPGPGKFGGAGTSGVLDFVSNSLKGQQSSTINASSPSMSTATQIDNVAGSVDLNQSPYTFNTNVGGKTFTANLNQPASTTNTFQGVAGAATQAIQTYFQQHNKQRAALDATTSGKVSKVAPGSEKGINGKGVDGSGKGMDSAKGAAISAGIGAAHSLLSSSWGDEGDYWYSPHGLQDLGDPFYNAGRTKYGHKTHKASKTLRGISSVLLGGSASAGAGAAAGGGGGAVSGYMALAAIVPQAIADILDNGWGVAWNEKLMNDVAANNQRASQMTSAVSKASNLDELSEYSKYLLPYYNINSSNVGEAGTFAGDKLDKKAAELNKAQDTTVGYLDRTFRNTASNLSKAQIENFLRNYSAFGGYLTRPKRRRK